MKIGHWFVTVGGAAAVAATDPLAERGSSTVASTSLLAVQQTRTPDSLIARQLAVRSIRDYYRGRAGAQEVRLYSTGPDTPLRQRVMAIAETLNRALDSAAVLAPRDSMSRWPSNSRPSASFALPTS
jgi:hypothetical protein